jgi:UDP:flavonoid glycosyltransferase YjiC (YdhE family)
MRILFAPLAGALGLGAIVRCIAIAEEAVMRGHTVAFLAPRDYPLIDELQFGERYYSPRPERPSGLSRTELAGEADSYPHCLQMRGHTSQKYLDAAIPAELEAIAAFQPDFLVTEMHPTVPILSAYTGIPFAATAATPYLDAYARRTSGDVWDETQALYVRAAARFGLEASNLEDMMHHRSALNIAPTISTLEPDLAKLPNTEYFGPVLSPRIDLGAAPEIDGERKALVYLGTGIVSIEELLPSLHDAFPAPEWGVLVASRSKSVSGRETPFVEGSVTVSFLPGIIRALQSTDVFVNRCGQNAVAAGLLAGVPMIGIPGTSPEPLYNLSSLVRLQAAVSLPGVPSGQTLFSAVRRLDQMHAARNATKLGDELRAGAGATGVVMAIESRR